VIDSSGPSADLKGVRGRQHLAHLAANLCELEKEQAAATFKGTYGFHPMLATLDNTGEFLAAQLRPGNAGANTAAVAPRGASSYSQRSWEELGGRFLGLMAYLDPKGEGDKSMPGKQRSCSGV
jgi:hypothetical protein